MLLTYGTTAPNPAKSGQKISPELELAGFAKKGQMPDLPEPISGESLIVILKKVTTDYWSGDMS